MKSRGSSVTNAATTSQQAEPVNTSVLLRETRLQGKDQRIPFQVRTSLGLRTVWSDFRSICLHHGNQREGEETFPARIRIPARLPSCHLSKFPKVNGEEPRKPGNAAAVVERQAATLLTVCIHACTSCLQKTHHYF